MILALTIFMLLLGIFLSGFFSGSETGFYRASRVRVVIAALEGDYFSKALVRLFNNPALFVATTLVGNNVANYLTSLSIVLLAKQLDVSSLGEMLAPILLSPMLFVYGELLPKNLFFQAPNLLLRLAAPLFLIFTIMFWPLAALLWAMSRILENLLGQSPEKIRLALARKEVQEVFEEGLEAGILHPTQRHLAQSFFLVAHLPVGDICQPLNKTIAVARHTTARYIKKLAKRKKLADIPVFSNSKSNIVGHVRTVDFLVNENLETANQVLREIRTVDATELAGEVILQMQANRETLLLVVDQHQKNFGLLSVDQLTDPLLNGPLGSLKR
jgi:CBS domain containing-hemolysin-like protein